MASYETASEGSVELTPLSVNRFIHDLERLFRHVSTRKISLRTVDSSIRDGPGQPFLQTGPEVTGLVRDIRGIAGNRRFLAAVLIGLSVLLIAYLHSSTTYSNPPLHSIYAELHYVLLLLAGLVFGFRGAALTSLLVSVLYGAYIFIDWPEGSLWVLDNSLHILFPAVFALLVGFFVDRERRHRR